ncbi:related to transporter (major facilitator superfamily) [Lecanosticta acicola]|uniref:Related to transporter (Major facilitator superfamily) n=1 Tax=Lecanosticta acicola TaxID=111012 RepID=A0AAI8Z8H2_9PEZI|nr:related to transporter (major facilitator superfamily) [Lecanosticta acicola]
MDRRHASRTPPLGPPKPNKPSRERIEAPVTFKAYLMCASAAFAGVLFGYDSGYISSVLGMNQFKQDYGHPVPASEPDDFPYNYYTWQKSLVVSILSAGTFVGALASGYLADRIGRRTTIIGPGCGVFVVGVIIQLATKHIVGLAVGRFVAGLGVGCVCAVNILYMSEVAPRKVRGAIVSAYQFAITIGIMMAACVGYATQDGTTSAAYRIPIALQLLWALILGVALFSLPESPRYWVKHNRLDKAARALARVRGQSPHSSYIEDELAEIVANCEYEQQTGAVSWKGCFTGGIRHSNSNIRKIFIGTALQMFQQWTGINFIFYYNVTFFQQVGLSNPFLISMVTTVVNVASTPVAFYTIEKFGRRRILIFGAAAMCLCEFIIAIVGVAGGAHSHASNYVLIVFVCIYIFFASSWGPAAWLGPHRRNLPTPLRPSGRRPPRPPTGSELPHRPHHPFLVDPDKGDLGVKVFFVWGSTCALSAAFAYLFIPETKGLTLEQVERMMEEVPAYTSRRWKPVDPFAGEGSGGAESPSPMEGVRPVKMEDSIEMR